MGCLDLSFLWHYQSLYIWYNTTLIFISANWRLCLMSVRSLVFFCIDSLSFIWLARSISTSPLAWNWALLDHSSYLAWSNWISLQFHDWLNLVYLILACYFLFLKGTGNVGFVGNYQNINPYMIHFSIFNAKANQMKKTMDKVHFHLRQLFPFLIAENLSKIKGRRKQMLHIVTSFSIFSTLANSSGSTLSMIVDPMSPLLTVFPPPLIVPMRQCTNISYPNSINNTHKHMHIMRTV